MRYLFVILLLSSCSTKFMVNGHEVKQRTKMVPQNERVFLISSFIVGYCVTPFIIR
jgi:hypothetical protein